MKATKKLTGVCEHCGGPIEFDASSIGQSVQCPFCRRQTEFHLPALPEEPLIPRRVVVWTIVTIILLVLGLVAAFIGLKFMEKKAAEHELQRQGQMPPANP